MTQYRRGTQTSIRCIALADSIHNGVGLHMYTTQNKIMRRFIGGNLRHHNCINASLPPCGGVSIISYDVRTVKSEIDAAEAAAAPLARQWEMRGALHVCVYVCGESVRREALCICGCHRPVTNHFARRVWRQSHTHSCIQKASCRRVYYYCCLHDICMCESSPLMAHTDIYTQKLLLYMCAMNKSACSTCTELQ